MPAQPKNARDPRKGKEYLEFPDEWDADAEAFLSEMEEFDEPPPRPKFPDVLFVYNLPIVGEEEGRFEKLQQAIKKKLSATKDASDPGFELEMHINPQTKECDGCAWLKFPSKKLMEQGLKRIDGFAFGKSNTLAAIPFDQYEEIAHTSEKFIPPPKGVQALTPTYDNGDWLLDSGCRDQLLLRFQQETEVHWIDILSPETLIEYYCGDREKAKGKVWCDWKVQWSKHGNYLVTFHKPGVCLWGGPSMVQKRKIIHDSVREIMFSPTEDYMNLVRSSDSTESKAYKIWDVKKGKCLKEVSAPTYNPSGVPGAFPHLIFSPDSRFLARNTDREINIQQMPSVGPYKRPDQDEYAPYRFENGIAHYQFSPKDNILSIWTPQMKDSPSCLVVINIETGKRLATKSRANFDSVLNWQSQGDYLCAILSKKGKIKDGKELAAAKPRTLDILRIRERNVPVETVDVEENVKGFYWEPKSNRFALLTEHKESSSKTMLYFYSLANAKCEVVATFELSTSAYNRVVWAPEGQYLVVAAMGSGELMWMRLTEKNQLELLYKDEQVNVTHIEWDSTGRYLLTGVVQPIEQASQSISIGQDAGFTLWTFQGRPLHSEGIEKLYGASFRPKPPLLLDVSEQKEIKKGLKAHSRRFEQIDDEARNKQRREERERKETKVAEFRAICHSLNRNFSSHAEHSGWAQAARKFAQAHAFRDVTDLVEELVETKEEFIDL